jgi:hypothetical protein
MYQEKTSGSAASNMTLSSPSSATVRATTSVRHSRTCSVIPSDLIMIMCAPGVEVALGELDRLSDVTGALGLQGVDCARSARALDPDLGLRLQPSIAHGLGQANEVVHGERDIAGSAPIDTGRFFRWSCEASLDGLAPTWGERPITDPRRPHFPHAAAIRRERLRGRWAGARLRRSGWCLEREQIGSRPDTAAGCEPRFS